MRFASLVCVSLSLAASSLCGVSADCLPASSNAPNQGVEPAANALTMFVTSQTYVGQIDATGGLTATDAACTAAAAFGGGEQELFNTDGDGNPVQWRAVLSTAAITAINRIPAGLNIKSYQQGGIFKCLAADRTDLYFGNAGKGYNLDEAFYDEAGVLLDDNIFVWSATGIPAAGVVAPAIATATSYGGRYFNGVSGLPADCSGWTSISGKGSAGIVMNTDESANNNWFQAPANEINCSNGYRLLCVSGQAFAPPTTPPGGSGDPQFTGLQGQSFQVHGMPEEFFNLITTPAFQLNSRFTYLASGNCNYNNTECWTHPGTYVDQLGFMFPGLQVKAIAGPHHKGLRVWINDEEMHRSSGRVVMTTTSGVNATEAAEVTVSHLHHDVLTVSFPLFTLEVTNSDWFFNFHVVFHASDVLAAGRPLLFIRDSRAPAVSAATLHYLPAGSNPGYPSYPMHGLVGQTWKNARYPSKRKYQGEVDDYMLLDHQLFSTQFVYNLYSF